MIRNRCLNQALAFVCPAALGVTLTCALASPARAQLKGTQTEGTIAPIPIAIPVFLGDDPQMASNISDVLQADLERSGLFRPLDRASFSNRSRTSTLRRVSGTGVRSRPMPSSLGASSTAATAASAPSSGCGTSRPENSSLASAFRRQVRTGGALPT